MVPVMYIYLCRGRKITPSPLQHASDLVLLLKLITVNADHEAAKIARVNFASNLKSAIRLVGVVGRPMLKKCH